MKRMMQPIGRFLKLLINGVWLYFTRERAGGTRLSELLAELRILFSAQWWRKRRQS